MSGLLYRFTPCCPGESLPWCVFLADK